MSLISESAYSCETRAKAQDCAAQLPITHFHTIAAEMNPLATLVSAVLKSLRLGTRSLLCLVSGGLILVASPLPADCQSVMHNLSAQSILSLAPNAAEMRESVTLKGVVTASIDLGVTIQDETAGIWVYCQHSEQFKQGDQVEVEGTITPGLFSPSIRASIIHKIGTAPLPRPRPVDFRELSTGNLDAQYVSITGQVRSMGVRRGISKATNVWLAVALDDGVVDVTFPSANEAEAAKLIDATVRIEAAAMCTKNQARQITAATLPAGSMADLTVLKPPPVDLFAQPLIPISKLMQYRSGTDYFHRVRVQGTVTYYKPGDRLILEGDGGQALLVMSTQEANIKIGDRIEVVGYPAPEGSGPILRDAVMRYHSAGQAPRPAAMSIADISSGATRYRLVSTEGYLLRRLDEPSSIILLIQSGSSLLEAELLRPPDSEALQNLREGSLIRVAGISMLAVEGTWNFGPPAASVLRYKLLLRSADDVALIDSPSWWTTRHVIYIATVLGILTLGFMTLVIRARMEQWRLKAVLLERERIAHEIHDTLAQSFAGIGFQLHAIRKALPTGIPELQQQVELATALVRHSHKEARRSIEPAPLELVADLDLLASLKESALKMVEGGEVVVTTLSAGMPRPLTVDISTALLRIGQEAIANAVQHADPRQIEIFLAYANDAVRVVVKDDGSGFVKSGGLLGFGLRGMRKRAANVSGQLEIFSMPGAGTRVEVTIPLPPERRLLSRITTVWKTRTQR